MELHRQRRFPSLDVCLTTGALRGNCLPCSHRTSHRAFSDGTGHLSLSISTQSLTSWEAYKNCRIAYCHALMPYGYLRAVQVLQSSFVSGSLTIECSTSPNTKDALGHAFSPPCSLLCQYFCPWHSIFHLFLPHSFLLSLPPLSPLLLLVFEELILFLLQLFLCQEISSYDPGV